MNYRQDTLRKSGTGQCVWCWSIRGKHDSQWSAIPSVASKLGCTAETLRKWVRQGDSRFPPAFAGVTGNDVRPRGPCEAAQ